MKVFRRTWFSMIRGLIIAPFGGLAIFMAGQLLLPVPVCAVLGIGAAAILAYWAIFSENIHFEVDDDGMFRYYKRGKVQNTFELPHYKIGYYRKTEWGILGDNRIDLKLYDEQGEQTEIEAGPLGTSQFTEMFETMEKYAIKNSETMDAGAKKKP
ncbi:MAG: hypothetical protein LBD31_03105 [Treponema sp.]|jgi:hypothetical protein|nr:hypothetical protein [Treponema sp.]